MSLSHHAYREGVFAAQGGKSAFDCPYKAALQPYERELWFRGFTATMRTVRADRLAGRDPDAVPRSEFGVESGRRAGKSIVGRSA